MVEINGSLGEGGGQVLRTSLTLSILTARPLLITHIRAGRSKPGLQPQHLAAVRAASASRGGGWEVVRLSERPWLPRMLVDDGIDLAAAAPLMKER